MRRKLSAALITLLFCTHAMAQDTVRTHVKCYVSMGANAGSLYGPRVYVSLVAAQKHELSLGAEAYLWESNNYPSDFDCQSCKHGLAGEALYGATLGYGYIIRPHAWPGRLRAVLRGAMLFGNGQMPDNFRRVVNPGPREDNYDFDYKSAFTVALLLRPTLDLALSRYCGLSFGPFGIFSKDFNGGGASLSVLVGRVGNKDSRFRHAVRHRRSVK